MMKVLNAVLVVLGFVSSMAYAGGWTEAAVPTGIDIERGNGVMIYGPFGNPGQCSVANRFYLKKSHPQYAQAYAAALAAFTAGKKLQVYVHACEPAGWYGVTSTTFNTVTESGAINILN